VTRGGVLLAVALTLVMAPATAAGQVAAQPDLMFVSRGGDVLTGDDLYNDDGVGQQRNVVVDQRVSLTLRIENEGDQPAEFVVRGSVPGAGFAVKYFYEGVDIASELESEGYPLSVPGGSFEKVKVVVRVSDPPFGAEQDVLITASSGTARDAVRITVTNVSTTG